MKRVERDILFVLISSFVLTVAWVGFNLYHKWATSTISDSLQIQIKPIRPDFDLRTLEKLKAREKVSPVFEAKSPSPTPTIAAPPPVAQPTQEEQQQVTVVPTP